jgi:hypothetical protein
VKSDGVKKPAFLVVRKKASLLQKKTLSEVKNFATTNPQSISKAADQQSSHKTEPQKTTPDDAGKFGAESNFKAVKPKKATKKSSSKRKSNWAVSDQSKSSTAGYNNTGIISSLFFKNPEIPEVTKDHVEATEENVFSSQSFSALKIHKYLVRKKIIKNIVKWKFNSYYLYHFR